MNKGLATTLIHSGEGRFAHVDSLTTPIFETTTFVFESADAVREYNEGASHYFSLEGGTMPFRRSCTDK